MIDRFLIDRWPPQQNKKTKSLGNHTRQAKERRMREVAELKTTKGEEKKKSVQKYIQKKKKKLLKVFPGKRRISPDLGPRDSKLKRFIRKRKEGKYQSNL